MLKFEDLIPQKAEFTLRITGKTYTILPLTAADEIWLQQKYGSGLEKILKEIRIQEISEIVFRQLEDKSDFIKRTVKIVNEVGDEVSKDLGGVDLFRSIISGVDEKLAIYQALLQTIGISRPVIDKLTSEDSEKKSLQTTGQPS